MKTKSNNNFIMQNKNIILIALAVAFILLLVLIAMQFSDEETWTLFDFAVAGALLFGTGLAYELISRRVGIFAYRAAIGGALVGALLLVWINLAVGIIGSEDNPLNMMYLGVLTVLIVGALIAQLRPQGMARTLFATALAQALVTVIAVIAEQYQDMVQIVMLNGFFVALWVGSALLFRHANATLNQRLE